MVGWPRSSKCLGILKTAALEQKGLRNGDGDDVDGDGGDDDDDDGDEEEGESDGDSRLPSICHLYMSIQRAAAQQILYSAALPLGVRVERQHRAAPPFA